jgi:TonB family protein
VYDVILVGVWSGLRRMFAKETRSHRFQRPSRLTLFIVVSLLLHTVVLLLGDRLFKPSASQAQPQALIPIDYVEIPSDSATKPQPENLRYRASHTSQAGGEIQPDRPVSAIDSSEGRKAIASPSAPPPTNTLPSQSDRSPDASSPVPLANQPSRSLRASATPTSPGTTPAAREQNQAIAIPPIQSPQWPVQQNQESINPARNSSSSSQPAVHSNQRSPHSNQNTARSSQPTGSSARDLLALSGNALTNTSINPDRSSARPPGVDASEDAGLAPYLDALREAVRQQWVRSPTERSRRTVVEFVITRSGQISTPQTVQTSGSDKVDQEAKAAIRRAAPFAPLPENYPHDMLMINFGFTINVYGDVAIDGN